MDLSADPQERQIQIGENNQTVSHDNAVTSLGYLHGIRIKESYKSLKEDFHWLNIPMLSVLTRENGCGKTAILEHIIQTHRSEVSNPHLTPLSLGSWPEESVHIKSKIYYKHYLDARDVQVGYYTSHTIDVGHSDASLETHKRVYDQSLQDLVYYHKCVIHNQQPQLKFPRNAKMYQEVVDYYNSEAPIIVTYDSVHNHDSQINSSLDRIFKQMYGAHIRSLSSIDNYVRYLGENTILTKLNPFLKNQGFQYGFSKAACSSNANLDYLRPHAELENDNVDFNRQTKLSSGEHVELLILLWAFHRMENSPGPALLILDEPDAHLHTRLSKRLVQVIVDTLVKKNNIQVIMITHNPTTVSLVPEGCVYVMDLRGNSPMPSSNQDAINFLTSELVYVKRPFRWVLVEGTPGKDDIFYETWYRGIKVCSGVTTQMDLSFKAVGSKGRVYEIVSTWNESKRSDSEGYQNATAVEQEVAPTNLLFGVVDGDNGNAEKKGVFVLKRYSIENYVLDPIAVFCFLLSDRHDNYFKNRAILMFSEASSQQKIAAIDIEHTTLETILQRDDFKDIIQSIIDVIGKIISAHVETLVGIMQKHFAVELDGTRNTNIKGVSLKDEVSKRSIDTADHDILNNLFIVLGRRWDALFELTRRCKILIDSERDADMTSIRILKPISRDENFKYDRILLKIRGHDLEAIYRSLNPRLSKHNLLEIHREGLILSTDVAQILDKLLNVSS